MTLEEKRKAISEYCSMREVCIYDNEQCPLYNVYNEEGNCYDTNDKIERNYEILFGKATTTTTDPIKPDYYNDSKISPIDVIEDWNLDFCLGSALKYIKRAGKKEGNSLLQDLKKVKWYIERKIRVSELEEASK